VAADLEAPLRGEPLFDAQGNPTIRFAEFLDRLGIETNDLIETTTELTIIELTGRLADIEVRLGTGDALTSDDTGFTVDSTIFTVDQTEA
jgi:hypothetical protein